ncbi:MAG: hydrolase, TatD family [Parcubacteria group bacterium Gr01-1014_17]|nr:MAG: hydrolase, TatD family [Parcubacteria group bacterium Gr01-1014_17]
MRFSYIDIHSHTNFAAFDNDRAEATQRAYEAGVALINVGTQQDTSRAAIEIAEQYENGVYAAVGLHPIHTAKSFHDEEELGENGKEFTSRGEGFDYEYYKKLALHPKVVAIGECGLDYYRHDTNTRMSANDANKKQEEAFRKQIELANEVRKPLMLHIRQAYQEAHALLKTAAKVPGNLHFFAGTVEDAKKFLELGYSFSFTGVVTFTHDYDEVVRYLPLERIMSETDCPYVAPVPFRGKRNEPAYVVEVVKKIAEIRNEDHESVRVQLLKNAEQFFGLQGF